MHRYGRFIALKPINVQVKKSVLTVVKNGREKAAILSTNNTVKINFV